MRILSLALTGAILAATGAQASGDALVIGNSRYTTMQTLFGAQRVDAAAEALRDKGFDVALAEDADAQEMRSAFGDFAEVLDNDGGPVVVVLAGAFVHGSGGAYLLPVTGEGVIDEADVLMNGFPLDAALTVLAAYQGRAFLVLAETAAEPDLDSYLSRGVGELDIPQGVTVIRGPAVDVARYAARDMARTGRFVRRAAMEYQLEIEGYAPQTQVIVLPEDVAPSRGAVEPPLQDPVQPRAADDTAWRLAQQADSAQGYRTYLDGFPDGAHARAARQRLNALNAEPFYRERRAEEALDLGRDARRAVQRALTILDHEPGGVDGIFGPGTRAAIRRWQEASGMEVSGYLSSAQVGQLQAQAARRAAELEEEAAREQAERVRQERVFWREVNQDGDETGFREYLRRYPEGQFAQQARRVLEDIDQQRAEEAVTQDRRDWAQAAQDNTIASYRAYLEDWPQGAFRNEAQQRITLLQQDAEDAQNASAARREEESMNLNFIARQLAEKRLDDLGLNPGRPDGRFDDQTRKALRRYQQSRGLRVSGYLDEQTVVRLLADSLIRP